MTHPVIAIVGGGISGLSAAYELASRGIPFTLFEAAERPGGLVHTEQAEGFTIEAGADSLLAQKRAGLELCAELGLNARLVAVRAPRRAFVLRDGVLYPLASPSLLGIPATWGGLATYRLLSPAARVRVAMEPVVGGRRVDLDESVGAFFRRRFGSAAVPLLAQPLLGGIHAGDVEALSMRALFPRLVEAERTEGSVLRWIQRTVRAPDSGGAFRSFPGGMTELVDALRRRLPDAAVRVRCGVSAIARRGAGWHVSAPDGGGQYRAVLLACPAHAAARLLEGVDADAAEACRRVRYVSTVSVALAWPRDAVAHPLAGTGFVVARGTTRSGRLTACTWVSSKWEGRAPAGQVLLRAYIGGAHDADAVNEDDETLVTVAVRELSGILSISGPPALARVHRWRDAGAQHEVGHLARIGELDRRLARLPGLFVTGSGFRATGIPDCIADGRRVATDAGAFIHAI